jgi:hypothetical protein
MADALDLGSSVLWTWGFKSPLAHRFLGDVYFLKSSTNDDDR